MKRLAINANGNTITSFAGELNPTRVGEYIYIYIYIYIYKVMTYVCRDDKTVEKNRNIYIV